MCDAKSLTKIFRQFDTDGSGQIDVKELREMIKVYYKAIGVKADAAKIKETVFTFLKALDENGDGLISLDEWLQLATLGPASGASASSSATKPTAEKGVQDKSDVNQTSSKFAAFNMCDAKSLKKIFREFDTDGSGQIDVNELREMIKVYYKAIGVEADAAKIKDTVVTFLKVLDEDGDGLISLDEWLQLATLGPASGPSGPSSAAKPSAKKDVRTPEPKSHRKSPVKMCDANSLKKIFREFDADGSGQIDINELREMIKAYYKALGVEADPAKIKDTVYTFLEALDEDGDGMISLDEWLQLATFNPAPTGPSGSSSATKTVPTKGGKR